MPMNPDDPRVRKTRRAMRQAFIRLILQKGYDAITIQDIADEAETARITFYRHYADKEELLMDCLNQLYDELAERTERITPEAIRSGKTPVLVLYEHIAEQEQLYRLLFSSRGTPVVIERLRHHLATRAMEAIRSVIAPDSLQAPLEIIAYHAAGAQIGLAIWWLDQGKPYPADYMARTSMWLSLAGVARALSVPDFGVPAPPLS